MMRKYGIVGAMRQASFFGNAIQETSWLQSLEEGYGKNQLYGPWHGRGFLQLTNPDNYCAYWAWRGRWIPSTMPSVMKTGANAICIIV